VVVAAIVAKEVIDTGETVGASAANGTNSMSGCCKIGRPMSLADKAKADEDFPQSLQK
jgi:hypothetical protein